MSDLVKIVGGLPIVTSKNIADRFGKIHRDVLRAIDNLECSEDFRERNFAHSSYTSPQNKILDCVNMTKDGFAFLCMGFTGKKAAEWKEKYIDAFNDMADKRVNEAPETMRALNELSKKIEGDKELASKCGTLLAEYKKTKKENLDNWVEGVHKTQMKLGFVDDGSKVSYPK